MLTNDHLEKKRQVYQEWLKKNPPIFDENTGYEMKECEGCYCQLMADDPYDFCFDCLDGERDCCVDREENTSNCLACYGKGKFKVNKPRKKLTFTQKQRLYWELIKQDAEVHIEEIKDHENPDYEMRTAQKIEDTKRWVEQDQQRMLKSLNLESKFLSNSPRQ